MKKIITILLLFITLTYMLLPAYSANAIMNKPANNIYKSPEHSKEELYQDIFCSLLLHYIQKSVSDYYSKFLTDIPTVDPWDINILSIERPNGYRTFVFVLKIQVIPYVGPHLDVGVDNLTITVDGVGNIKINNFQHIKDPQLPPNYQHIVENI